MFIGKAISSHIGRKLIRREAFPPTFIMPRGKWEITKGEWSEVEKYR